MRVVGLEREILEAEIEQLPPRGIQPHFRKRPRRTRQLLARLLQVVQIQVSVAKRDANGKPISANSLNLPVIALADAEPEIGDRIFVFGYPSLGDAHLVMTSGSVTTIENDTLNGARIPYWYQTDAQISPGNSLGHTDILGDLTMHGVTKEITLHVKFLGKGKGMGGKAISGWQVMPEPIKRSDYGLNWSKAVEGTAVIGDEVTISIDIESDKAP